MKTFYFLFLFLSFVLYEIFAKGKFEEINQDSELIEDDEFVYSSIEDLQKNTNQKKEEPKKPEVKLNEKEIEEMIKENLKLNKKNVEKENNRKKNEIQKKEQKKKEKSLNDVNVLSSYPYLNIGLYDLLEIAKKLSLSQKDVLEIWEYFLRIKKKYFFDFLFLSNANEELINDKDNNTSNSNYMFFHSFDLIKIFSNPFDSQNILAVMILVNGLFMHNVPNRMIKKPKLNLAILLSYIFVHYILMDYLYYKRFYFCSFLVYVLFVFNIEKIWNTIFLIEHPEELEENLNNTNKLFDHMNFKTKGKFKRKVIISLIILFFSIYISFTKFRTFYFYAFHFYILRFIRLIMIRYFKYSSDTPIELQPFENFIDILLAVFCLVISNFYYYSNSVDSHDLLGLIVIYNLISFYYLTSLDKFMLVYRNGLSDIYLEFLSYTENENNEKNEKSQKDAKNSQSAESGKNENSNISNENKKETSNSINQENKQVSKKKREREKEKEANNNKSEEDSSDEEILTYEQLKKYDSFDKIVEKINLKRYYRIDILNMGNITDVIIVSLIFVMIILSIIADSLYFLFLGIYLTHVFTKHNAIYLSTKYSRLVSNLIQIITLIAIYNINFHTFDTVNLLFFNSEDSNHLKISLKLLSKFVLLILSNLSLFCNQDFFAYFDIYNYTTYKYILQEGINPKRIKDNTEVIYRINEVYNIKSGLEEIFNFKMERSLNHLNYIFENCKFTSKKTEFFVVEYCLGKNTKHFNLILLLLDYFSLYFCYWLVFLTFKDNGNFFFYLLFLVSKMGLIAKLFFINFEYTKSPQQKFMLLFLNTIFFNRLRTYFSLFYFEEVIFFILSYLNKSIYIHSMDNSFILNVFFTFLELLEFRKYGNFTAFVLILTFLCNKSLLFCLGRTSKKAKVISFSVICLLISGFLYSQIENYLYILYDSMKEKIIQTSFIDWLGVAEYINFNSITIPVKYSGKIFEDSIKNSIFIEVVLVREFLKFLVKVKMFLI